MSRVITERSAGGVLLVRMGPAVMAALIRTRGGGVLGLPKGHIEAGETPAQAAVRETREETGLRGRIIGPLEDISYVFWSRAQSARIAKQVSFFLLEYRSGSVAHHDGEVEGVRLVALEEAVGHLTYPGERRVAERALAWARAEGYGGLGAKDGQDGPD